MWICQKLALFLGMEQFSVITICFNNLSDLKATCDSVDKQTSVPYEHYIINGSTNTEIENWLLQTPQPSYRKWLNEPDEGISDAFNKGVQKATGSILHLLNAGDCYFDENAIQKVHACFIENPNTQWISGNIYMNRNGTWVKLGVPFDKNQMYKGMRSVSHPTWFLRKEVYDSVGVFSLAIKIAMDYDLLCRLTNEKYYYLNETLVLFDDKGVSTTQYLNSLKDNITVFESYNGFSFKSRLWQFRLRLIYYLMQTKFGKWLYQTKSRISR
jgi:GT2 family glycosyltransferase